MLSSHLEFPREGHLEEVLHVFAYLKKHMNLEIVFDPTTTEVDMNIFQKQDWSFSVYSSPEEEFKEEFPPNMLEPLGLRFVMRVYVDSDHVGESVTRRSRSGYIVFLNSAPIYWLSKKQTSCETSTFRSEFVAMKQAREYTRSLQYKLRMFGIPVTEPAFVHGDNQSVLCNKTTPQSVLKKKPNEIHFHFLREGCARDEWRMAYINTHLNVADLMTEPLAGIKRWKFVQMMQHYL